MITVGLAKELAFISRAVGVDIEAVLSGATHPLKIKLSPDGSCNVWYNDVHIWQETVSEDSFFGVESCDTIARIMFCIDNGSSWDQYRWYERP